MLCFLFFQQAFVLSPLFCVSNPLVPSISSVWFVISAQRLAYEASFIFTLTIKPRATFIFTDSNGSFQCPALRIPSLNLESAISLSTSIKPTASLNREETSFDEQVSKYCCAFSAFHNTEFIRWNWLTNSFQIANIFWVIVILVCVCVLHPLKIFAVSSTTTTTTTKKNKTKRRREEAISLIRQ